MFAFLSEICYNNPMGKIILLMGKSASGKDAVYRNLLQDETLSLKKVVLYTTRPMRLKEEASSISLWMRTPTRT